MNERFAYEMGKNMIKIDSNFRNVNKILKAHKKSNIYIGVGMLCMYMILRIQDKQIRNLYSKVNNLEKRAQAEEDELK